jgi:protein involved in polysaccharide export with SLBB domain
MRVTRSLILVFAVAITAAGCAQRPVARVAVAPAPAPGIDNTIYGPIAAPPPPRVVATGRGLPVGLFATPGPRVAAVAPAPALVAAPVVAAPLVPTPIAFNPGPEGPYTLDSGDRLRVVVFGQDGLTNSYVVGAGGHIDMPLIGPVLARGATTDQLAYRIADRLRQGFIREPHVAVEIEAYRPFFILGEVTQPGQYPYVANMTVETAVAIAGGFAPRAYRQTVVLTRFVDGQQVRMTVPVTCPIRPGDTLNIQERWF